jgi:hypothetical protein
MCLRSARFIRGGKQYYLKSAYPQPASQEIFLPFGVGLTGKVSIKLTDQLGRVVLEPVEGIILEGEYEMVIPTTALPAGVYSLIYTAGKFSAVQPLLINR